MFALTVFILCSFSLACRRKYVIQQKEKFSLASVEILSSYFSFSLSAQNFLKECHRLLLHTMIEYRDWIYSQVLSKMS